MTDPLLTERGSMPVPEYCPKCRAKIDAKPSNKNGRKGKIFLAKCKCGAAWRLTPLPWYKAALI